MLAVAHVEDDNFYWETDATKPPSPKRKCPQDKEELLDDSISMVKTAMSIKKRPKSVLKGNASTQEWARPKLALLAIPRL